MLRGSLSGASALGGSLSASGGLSGTLTTGGRFYPTYGGATTVTPSETAQVLATEGCAVLSDTAITETSARSSTTESKEAS